MISEKLSGFYTKLEDKYFDVLDVLDKRGLPVYAYSDFFEEKGIPSFIVTIAILILLIIGASFLLMGPVLGSGEITFTLRDSSTNQPLQNVSVSLFDEQNNPIDTFIVSDGSKVNIPPQPQGTRIKIFAQKDGYHPSESEIVIGKTSIVPPPIYLNKQFVGITAQLRITDSQTGTRINNAVVKAKIGERIYNFRIIDGIYGLENVPEGETLLLEVVADGYTTINQEIIFFGGSIRDIAMTPSDSGFVGNATLLITVKNKDGLGIDGAEVIIYNKENQAVLLKKETEQGAVSGQIQTGIPLRITIKKDGYVFYDSDNDGGITIREREKKLEIFLNEGGEKLTIIVANELGSRLSNILVTLFDETGKKMLDGITTNEGITFSGIDPEKTIFVTAYQEGFIPNRTKILVKENDLVTIILQEVSSSNSFRLDFFALDELGNNVPNALITLREIVDGNILPLGYDEIMTSLSGYASKIVKTDTVYSISAETTTLEGSKIIELKEEPTENRVQIDMRRKPNVVEMRLIDLMGENIRGNAIVSALDGTKLFEGPIENGKIFFNKYDNKTAELQVMLEDGNIFTENVFLQGKDLVEVVVYQKDSSELSPEIEFVGIERETGEKVNGITPGEFYWISFSVKWPLATEQGGVHFRVGEDNIEIVGSQNIAIFDLSLQNSEKFFSYTFNPEPLPGNESIDRTNKGFENEPNKWVEGTINNPRGTHIAKVKIRVSDFTAGKVPIHYRAWGQVSEETYRIPFDNVLENKNISQEKNSLYAQTLKRELTLFESLPQCNETICVAMNFVDEEEKFFDLGNFEAIQGKVYALEAELTSIVGDYLQINATTNTGMYFVGTQTANFNFVKDSGFTTVKEASSTVSLTPNGKQKIRFYFVGEKTGTNVINLNISGKEDFEKTIAFETVIERELLLEVSEKRILLGRNFTIKVLDQDLTGVSDALIRIINKKGEVVKSVVGNNTDGQGRNGLYRVQNNLEQGVYTIRVSAQRYKQKEEHIIITNQDILSFPEELNAKLLLDQKTKTIQARITNNSEFDISNISIQTDFSENFVIETPSIPNLSKQQSHTIPITIKFVGNQSVEENLELKIQGMVENTYMTSVSSILNLSYDRELNSNCLVITPSTMKLVLIGNQGSQAIETLEVRNNCEVPIALTSEKIRRSFVILNSENISLGPGQISNITITATNTIDRVFNRNENYSFDIVYDSNYLTKTLPITIELINPRIALSYPGQLTLFLAQNSAHQKAIAIHPIFVTNVSQFSVENIGFSVNTQYATQGNVRLSIEPPTKISLEKGQSIFPTKMVVAEATTRFTEPVRSQILITGTMGNLDSRIGMRDNYSYENFLLEQSSLNTYRNQSTGYNTGTDTLGVIEVITHYSGFDCLKVSGLNNASFNITQEGVGSTRKVTIMNDCAEPVRLIDVKAQYPNLFFSIPQIVINPGEMIETQIGLMTLGGRINLREFPIEIRGITEISQSPIQTNISRINIFAGVNFNEEYSKAETGIRVNVCEEGEERIDIPKNAVGNDCSNGYCDAQQAAEYIAKKLDQAIRRAEAQAYSAQRTNEAIARLRKGFFTFDDIGTQETSFDLYFKNDVLSVNVLKDAFEEISKGSTGFTGFGGSNYRFETGVINETILGQIARTGYGRQIIIDNRIVGCGYYNIEIGGVFPVSPQGVDFTAPIITIKASDALGEFRTITKECVESIENLINFTPFNEKYSLRNTGGTWLTSIEAENNLEELAKRVSKSLFKNEDRVGFGNGNKIILKERALTNALAEICLIGGEKKIIEININPATSTMNEQTRIAFEQEITKLITNAIHGNFGNNCLVRRGENYSCVRLEDASGFEKGLQLKLDSKTIRMTKDGGCVSGEVISNIPEEIVFSFTKHETEKKFTNVTKIIVEEENGRNIYEIDFTTGRIPKETIIPIRLEQADPTTEKDFAKNIRVCAYSTNEANVDGLYLQSNGVQFVIRALNKNAGRARGTLEEDGKITIITDSLHPDDLITLLTRRELLGNKRGEENPYYFTVMWKGEPQEIPELSDYSRQLRALGFFDQSLIASGDGTPETTLKALDIEAEERKKAIHQYLIWCTGTTTACNLTTGFLNTGFSIVADCGIPAVTVFRKDLAENYDWFKSTFETLAKIPLVGRLFEIPEEFVDTKQWNPFINQATITGGVAGGIQNTTLNAIRFGTLNNLGKINSGVVDWTANQMGEQWLTNTQEALKNSFNTATLTTQQQEFATRYSTELKTEFSKNLDRLYREAVRKKVPIVGRQVHLDPTEVNQLIARATQDATTSVNTRFANDAIFQTTILGTSTSPQQVLANITPSSPLGQTLNSMDVTREIPTIIGRQVDSIPTDLVTNVTDITQARTVLTDEIRRQSSLIAAEIGQRQGLTGAQIQQLATDISSNATSNPNLLDDIVMQNQQLVQRGGLFGGTDTITGHAPSKARIQGILQDSTNTAVRRNSSMFEINPQAKAKLMETFSNDVGGRIKATDLSKRTFREKMNNLFSLENVSGSFWRSIGRSIGCGMLANMVGLYQYNKNIGESSDELNRMLTELPIGTLEKGRTYKMILDNRLGGETDTESGFKATIELVETEEDFREMTLALEEKRDKEINGILLKWHRELNEKRPEERPLTKYYLETDPVFLRQALLDVKIERTRINQIMTIIRNTFLQKLVQKYVQDDTITVTEEGILATIIIENPTETDLKRELESDMGAIKEKLTRLMQIFERNNSINIDLDVAKEFYPQESKAKEFYTIANALRPLERDYS